MNCSACGTELAAHVKFCSQCGASHSTTTPDHNAHKGKSSFGFSIKWIMGIALLVAGASWLAVKPVSPLSSQQMSGDVGAASTPNAKHDDLVKASSLVGPQGNRQMNAAPVDPSAVATAMPKGSVAEPVAPASTSLHTSTTIAPELNPAELSPAASIATGQPTASVDVTPVRTPEPKASSTLNDLLD